MYFSNGMEKGVICVPVSKNCRVILRLVNIQNTSFLCLFMSCATKSPLDPTAAPFPTQSLLTASLQESPAPPFTK